MAQEWFDLIVNPVLSCSSFDCGRCHVVSPCLGIFAGRERRYDYAASATFRKHVGPFGKAATRHNPGVGITFANVL
jgi:hypothetical protein